MWFLGMDVGICIEMIRSAELQRVFVHPVAKKEEHELELEIVALIHDREAEIRDVYLADHEVYASINTVHLTVLMASRIFILCIR
jgi:hypothetical protein